MSTTVEVGARPAVPVDLPRLRELAEEAHDATAALARGGEMWSLHDAGRRSDDGRSALDGLLDDDDALALVGTLDDEVVGYAVVRTDALADGRRLARVSDLYVEDAGRGVGVGAAMLGAVVDWAQTTGCIGVDAWALPGERETKNFFEASGFTARLLVVHKRFTDGT